MEYTIYIIIIAIIISAVNNINLYIKLFSIFINNYRNILAPNLLLLK